MLFWTMSEEYTKGESLDLVTLDMLNELHISTHTSTNLVTSDMHSHSIYLCMLFSTHTQSLSDSSGRKVLA